MFEQLFLQTEEYKKLAGALSGKGACALFGLPAAGRALVYAALSRALGRTLCIVTPGEAEATRFAADLNTLGVAAAVFPARDYLLRPIESAGREYEYRRLAVLGDLAGGRLQAVCVPSEGPRISAPTPARCAPATPSSAKTSPPCCSARAMCGATASTAPASFPSAARSLTSMPPT